MNILLISHFFPPNYNAGTENYTLGLAQAFLDRDHQVEVLCAEGWQTGDSYWNGVQDDIYDGVPVHRIHLNWTKAKNPNRVIYDSNRVENWLSSFLDKHSPDVVHIISAITLGAGVIRSAKQHRISIVLTLMDFWFLCARTILLKGNGLLCDGITTPWDCQECLLTSSNIYRTTEKVLPRYLRSRLWRSICKNPSLSNIRGSRGMALDIEDRKAVMKEVMDVPDVILSHSRFVQQTFAEAGLSNRIKHLPNGHDLNWTANIREKQKSDLIRFGYLGQISHIKGIHIMIEAFKRSNLSGIARLNIWGDTTKDEDYTGILQEIIGDTNSITLQGLFPRNQIADILADIDILIVPSIWYENAPLVIYEAFAAKTPVIATNIGGMAEAVTHEVNGLLFERNDVQNLSSQMFRIVNEPGLLDKLQVGIPPVKRIEEEVVELEQIYKEVFKHK